jgi:hypothetical protein
LIFSPEATRYCLPPVFMTAYMLTSFSDCTAALAPRAQVSMGQAQGTENYSTEIRNTTSTKTP